MNKHKFQVNMCFREKIYLFFYSTSHGVGWEAILNWVLSYNVSEEQTNAAMERAKQRSWEVPTGRQEHDFGIFKKYNQAGAKGQEE